MGQQESASPFIKKDSRMWGVNLTLKSSILAACLLVCSFILSRFEQTANLSYLSLIGVYFLAGIPSLIESIEDLINFEINIDILMTLAAFSSVLIGSGMEGGLLLVLFSLSGAMEDAVTAKAKSSLSSLHKLSPSLAAVLEPDGTLIERSVKDIPIGTTILVKSGQVVPLDGKIISGVSSVNLVHLTGENFPIRKQPPEEVPAGARNLEGSLTITVTRTSAESTLTHIIRLVTQAQEAKPALQRWFDKLSRGYALSIISASAILAVIMPFFLHIPFFGVEGSLYRALAFLIAASPCALIIAIPIAYLSAVSVCASHGILLKGGVTLDALASCSSIAFDKTGTLTTGNLTCEGIFRVKGTISEEEGLAAAYTLERNAVHPIAKAIIDLAKSRNSPIYNVSGFRSIPGYGLEGSVELPSGLREGYIGHSDYILDKVDEQTRNFLLEKIEERKEGGKLLTVMLLQENVYLFSFRDTPRPGIHNTIGSIQEKGIGTVMLTGDHHASAQLVAEEVGIGEFYADLKPEDKLLFVGKLAKERGLAMVGDGVNDAPALARATVGICMGKIGSEAAIDAADIVLLHDNIEALSWLIDKAKKTQSIVKQNLTLATVAILAASFPALAGIVPLWLAVIMHEGGTVLVGLNALRLLKK